MWRGSSTSLRSSQRCRTGQSTPKPQGRPRKRFRPRSGKAVASCQWTRQGAAVRGDDRPGRRRPGHRPADPLPMVRTRGARTNRARIRPGRADSVESRSTAGRPAVDRPQFPRARKVPRGKILACEARTPGQGAGACPQGACRKLDKQFPFRGTSNPHDLTEPCRRRRG